jgi:formylglycine-generating enzyme required for sulfatase activity
MWEILYLKKLIRHTRWRLWGGGVLLSVLVTALYLVLSGRTPGPQPQPEPRSARTTEGTPPASSLTNSLGMEFVLVPAGTFTMGSPDADAEAYDDEKPAHRVTISQPFYLGKYEVTQAQWEAVMGTNPSHFIDNLNRPVENVSWEDVQHTSRTHSHNPLNLLSILFIGHIALKNN